MRPIEATVMRAMLSKHGWMSLQDVIKMDTFKSVAARKLYKTMDTLHDVTDGDITIDTVKLELDATYHLKRDLFTELLDEWRAVEASPDVDQSTLKHTVKTMVQRAKALEAADYIATSVDTVEFDPQIPKALFEEAADLEGALDADVEDYATASAPGLDDRKGVRSLNIHPDMDRALDGGHANGEFMYLLAPSGHGKTSTAIHYAASCAKLGDHVLHVTLEDHKHKVWARYDSALTGLDKDDLRNFPQKVMAARHALPGKIYVMDWSQRGIQPSDVRSLLMRMAKNGQQVSLVVVDYVKKMTPDQKPQANELPYGLITMELRRIATMFNVKMVSGWQTNRGGFGQILLSAEDVGSDIGVYQECDIMIGINQSTAQANEKRAIFNKIKGRDGTYKPACTCHTDFDRMIIREADTKSTNEGDEDAESYSADK